jgi:NAD(P)-dependent dehydrogenase (short-subunit alcohol dehydrogenase family)
MDLTEKTILVTGGARRIGRAISLAAAEAGANVIVHHNSSPDEAEEVRREIIRMGRAAWVLQADLNDPAQASGLLEKAFSFSVVDCLVNNAAIFGSDDVLTTSLETWEQHLAVNLTAPFLLSQSFARLIPSAREGRILNILDWRALRPGADHFAYTISKAALAAMTRSLAIAFAPRILVNGLAFGAILPPADGGDTEDILKSVPAGRWADLREVTQSVVFLLAGPTYITGEILHLDGGRHLV